jgi:hypothetical protein
MSVQFDEEKVRVTVDGRYVGDILQLLRGSAPKFCCESMTYFSATDLRAIADKLEELNREQFHSRLADPKELHAMQQAINETAVRKEDDHPWFVRPADGKRPVWLWCDCEIEWRYVNQPHVAKLPAGELNWGFMPYEVPWEWRTVDGWQPYTPGDVKPRGPVFVRCTDGSSGRLAGPEHHFIMVVAWRYVREGE